MKSICFLRTAVVYVVVTVVIFSTPLAAGSLEGRHGAAEKVSATTKCVQACNAEHHTCAINSANELTRHCDMPWLVCRKKCK